MTSSQEPPLLTVITVCLNRADTIAVALESVLRQQATEDARQQATEDARQQATDVADQHAGDIEHLVIDGVSTDGTMAVIERYSHVRVVSEPDKGLYDAMNKGLRLARGRYVLLLNSDDALAPGIIAAARPHMLAGTDAICFGTDFRRGIGDGRSEVIESITAPDAIVLSPATATLGSPLLNAKILRRDFLASVGEFDQRYRLASDVDFLLRVALAGPSIAVLPIVGHHYLEHAGSLTINAGDSGGRRAAEECRAIAAATLQRTDLTPRVRFLLRAWQGGKAHALAVRERRVGAGLAAGLATWARLLPEAANITRFGLYLVQRKLRTPEQRLAAELALTASHSSRGR